MKITFFIGNGFDINIGLKTSYSDFYPDFIKKATSSNMIKKWLIEDMDPNKKADKKELLWSDLEETLGQKLVKVKVEEVEKLYDDKIELAQLLLDYLEKEQAKFRTNENEKEIAKEFARSLAGFSSNLSEVGKDSIKQTSDKYASEDFKYCFICFNYTNILDQMISLTKRSNEPISTHRSRAGTRQSILDKILHIHGTLDGEMVLGVNDADQINNPVLKNDPDFLDAFVKKNINDELGQKKIEQAKEIIDESHIICIYGMSIGNTDKMWWEEIVEWLKKSKDNKLIIYVHSSEDISKRNLPLETNRLNKRTKNKLLEKGGVKPDDLQHAELSGRIFISYKHEIFNFEGLLP